MPETPFVSIILPVYNGARTLKATLESLLNQTYTHFELLIGIDGTKDESKSIAESFKDSRIQIIEHPKNLGLANNLNILVNHMSPKSEFIAIAEQDDIYTPKRLQWQIDVFLEHPNVGLVSGIAEFIGDGKSINFPGILVHKNSFSQGEVLFRYLYINQLKVVNTCMMIRKSVHIENNLNFKNTYGNFNVDWDYVLRFTLISKVYGIPKVLVQMNRQTTNVSVTTNKLEQYRASRQLLKDFKKEFPNLIENKTYQKALKKHRKIELGYHSKIGIIAYGLLYFLKYWDLYFLKYLIKRSKHYLKHNKKCSIL